MSKCKACGKEPPETRTGLPIPGAVRCETCPGPGIASEKAAKRKRGAVAVAIVAHLREHGESSARDLVDAGAGAQAAVYSTIGHLVASGEITGRSTPAGRERLWSLTA